MFTYKSRRYIFGFPTKDVSNLSSEYLEPCINSTDSQKIKNNNSTFYVEIIYTSVRPAQCAGYLVL